MTKEKDFVDRLKVEGILHKGFGHISKFVMLDTDLTKEAKGIYLYFCSFAGSGDTAFPSVAKIRSDLNISKDSYYKHYKSLIEEGYLLAEQSRYRTENQEIRLGNNVYTLVSNPKKFQERKERFTDRISKLRVTGLKALGYGTIPKAIMIDKRLHINSKAIYGYFASFAGNGDTAFPELENILYHLGMSKSTYYKYFNELIKLNYITVEQRKVEGRFSVNDYYLNETPDITNVENKPKPPFPKIQDTGTNVENKPKPPFPKIQDTQKQDTQKQDTQKQDTQKQDTIINNSSLNTNSIYYNQSINQQTTKIDVKEIERMNLDKIKELVKEEMIKEKTLPYRYTQSNRVMGEAIKLLTEYDIQVEWYNANKFKADSVRHSIYLLFNEALTEMLTTEAMRLKGAYVTYAKIYDKLVEGIEINDRYMAIGDIMENAINDFKSASEEFEIYNPIKYMQSVIWNALQIGNVRIETEINREWGF